MFFPSTNKGNKMSHTPEPPNFKKGGLICLVFALLLSLAVTLPLADAYINEEVGVSAPVSLCEESYLCFYSFSPLNHNVPYTDTWELTEGIGKYASRTERLHL